MNIPKMHNPFKEKEKVPSMSDSDSMYQGILKKKEEQLMQLRKELEAEKRDHEATKKRSVSQSSSSYTSTPSPDAKLQATLVDVKRSLDQEKQAHAATKRTVNDLEDEVRKAKAVNGEKKSDFAASARAQQDLTTEKQRHADTKVELMNYKEKAEGLSKEVQQLKAQLASRPAGNASSGPPAATRAQQDLTIEKQKHADTKVELIEYKEKAKDLTQEVQQLKAQLANRPAGNVSSGPPAAPAAPPMAPGAPPMVC